MPKTQYKKGDKKVLRAWAFYDWANSVYALVISTAIFPLYLEVFLRIINMLKCLELITKILH